MTLKIPEDFLHDVTQLIRRSFKTEAWKASGPDGRDRLIESSASQAADLRSLHALLNGPELGCTASQASDNTLAGKHWIRAFDEVDLLVQSSYHDILPNLVQQLNDLRYRGYGKVAQRLRDRIVISSSIQQRKGALPQAVLLGLEKLDLEQLEELEKRIVKLFLALFQLHLGPHFYNTFVMRMNAARRRLERSPWIGLGECVPDLGPLEEEFGACDRRPLDVIRLRTEMFYRRALYDYAEIEGALLAQRADAIQADEWLRLYFGIKGRYHVGCAQNRQPEKRDRAGASLYIALRKIQELSQIDGRNIFGPENHFIRQQLDGLGIRPPVTDILPPRLIELNATKQGECFLIR